MNIDIINGNGEYVKRGIDKILDYAIDFYGNKYEKNVLDTISEVKFYEWEDNQTEADVIYDITDGKVDEKDEEDEYYDTCGFYFLNVKNENECDKIVAFRNKFLKENYHFLVHELFGHAVFSNVDPIFFLDGVLWERNGIAFLCDKDNIRYYEYLNEGFVEDVVSNIMSNARLEYDFLEHYLYAKQAASVIRRHIGHENLYDSLILGNIDLRDMYNLDSKYDEFSQLEQILDNYYNYGRHPKLSHLYNTNLRNFIKRNQKKKKLVRTL
ncbi:MAG: hypothetical protein VZS44_03855 [Bacilli bacterium]|nr:hypothetical protein [Bacilli bacterium]